MPCDIQDDDVGLETTMIAATVFAALVLPTAQPTVAVLPGRATSTPLLADVDVDDALASGIDPARARLLPRATVDGVITRARANGLRCDPGSIDCAARTGAFGGFDFVIVPTFARHRTDGRTDGRDDGRDDDDGWSQVSVVLVDCTTGRAVRTAQGPIAIAPTDARRGLQALARAVLDANDDGARATLRGSLRVDGEGDVVVDGEGRGVAPLSLELSPGSHVVQVGRRPARGITVPVAAVVTLAAVGDHGDDHPWPVVGVTAAIAGSAVALGGLVGAAAIAPDPTRRAATSAADYNDDVVAGRALLVVAGAGVALCAAGIALWATSGPQ